MSSTPTVIVKKGGFLATVARGLFGSVMVVVICGTVLGVYALRTVDRHVTSLFQSVASAWPEWQKALPPVLSDAVNDRRAPEYRESVNVTARVEATGKDDDQRVLVLQVANKGQQTISLLALHVVLENDRDVPVRDFSVFAATPLAIEHDWRGPLFPGETRKIVERLHDVSGAVKAEVETTELRLWSPPAPAHAEKLSAQAEQASAEKP